MIQPQNDNLYTVFATEGPHLQTIDRPHIRL